MAVHCAAFDGLHRDGSYLNHAQDFTIALWAKFGADPSGSTKRLIYLWGAPSGGGAYLALISNTDTGNIFIQAFDGFAFFVESSALDLSGGEWEYLVMRYDSTAHTLDFINPGGLDTVGTISVNLSGINLTAREEHCALGGFFDFSLAHVRLWQAKLTDTQLFLEHVSITPVRSANLLSNTGLTSTGDITDTTGNGHNWITGSGLTTVAGPLPPANLTPSTAVDITALPYTATIPVNVTPQNVLWFVYTPNAGTSWIGFEALVALTANYGPETTVWSGTPSTLTPYPAPTNSGGLAPTAQIDALDASIQFMTPTGTKYYVLTQWVSDTAAPDTALSVSAVAGPNTVAMVGSILVPDDTVNFPAVLLNSTTGAILQARPYPAGEKADILPSGIMLATDLATNGFKLLAADCTPIATVLANAGSQTSAVCCDHNRMFYAGLVHDTSNASVSQVSDAGLVGASWTLAHPFGPFAMAISPDASTLYYVSTNNINEPVHRFDLVNNVSLTDLVAGDASYITGCVLVMTDGTILVQRVLSPAGPHSKILRYNPNGTLAQTYDFPTTLANLLAYSGDSTSFWIWFYLSGAVSEYRRVALSDGSTISTVSVSQYEKGVYKAGYAATPARFGPSFSCPFMVLPQAVPAFIGGGAGGGTGGGTAITVPIRRVRQSPHLSNSQVWQFFSMFQLDIEAGVGLTTGQGSDPQIMLQWSDDGGHTWSPERWVSAGTIGEYRRRAIWRRLGRSRDRVWRVAVTDPVAWRILQAFTDVSMGTS